MEVSCSAVRGALRVFELCLDIFRLADPSRFGSRLLGLDDLLGGLLACLTALRFGLFTSSILRKIWGI